MKSEVIESGVQVFRYLADGCSQEGMEKADESFSAEIDEIGASIQHIRIPILTNDNEVKEYIEMFDLQKPENMIRFFVEGYVATIEGIYEGVNDLKVQNLQIVLGEVKGAANMVKMGMDNPNIRKEKLSSAQNQLLTASEKLENLLRTYIDKLSKIDQRSRWKFFLKSSVSVSDIDTNCACAKQAVEALEMIVRTQMLIAVELGTKIDSSVITPYLNFLKETFSDSVCDLMHAYDKDKQEGYWKKFPEKLISAEKVVVSFREYVENAPKNINQKGGFLKWRITAEKKQKNRERRQ